MDTRVWRVTLARSGPDTLQWELIEVGLHEATLVERFDTPSKAPKADARRIRLTVIDCIVESDALCVDARVRAALRPWTLTRSGDQFGFYLLRASAYPGASGVYGELRFHPIGEPTIAIRSLERRHEPEERQAAWMAVDGLRERLASGGRPPGTGKLNQLTRDIVLEAYAECLDGVDWEPSKPDVCDRIGWIKERTLERWMAMEKLLWPPSRWPEWPKWRPY